MHACRAVGSLTPGSGILLQDLGEERVLHFHLPSLEEDEQEEKGREVKGEAEQREAGDSGHLTFS